MKAEILGKLDTFKGYLTKLKALVNNTKTERISRKDIRELADTTATYWVEELRSPLEHKLRLPDVSIRQTSEMIKKLHVLSRPNNLRSSYLTVLNALLRKFDDRFVLPIKQMVTGPKTGVVDISALSTKNLDKSTIEYLQEAANCANSGYYRASVVMGWCAGIDRIQRKIQACGFAAFNQASSAIKAQTAGKFRHWNKEYRITTVSELQTVFDRDLIIVLEGMNLLDGNQAQRLNYCFDLRNNSAHPGDAPVEQTHVQGFFVDVIRILLENEKFDP